jgi:hypothetical protein
MTDEELQAIEARLNAATPGEWKNDDPRRIRHAEPNIWAGEKEIADVFDNYGYNDSDFIAAAPADIRALLAEVRRLRAGRE